MAFLKVTLLLFSILVLTQAFKNELSARAGNSPYCQQTCTIKGITYQHTECIYGPQCTLKGQCANTQQHPIGPEQIQWILDTHNTVRQRVASGQEPSLKNIQAANMNELKWDAELATIADCWAKQCIGDHDKCRNRLSGGQVGQNECEATMNGGSPGTTQTKGMWDYCSSGWAGEAPKMPKSDIDSFSGDLSAGHFTQEIWAATTHVGCARVFSTVGNSYTFRYFCNYSPAGNWKNEPVFKQGPAGSACKVRSSKYSALCA